MNPQQSPQPPTDVKQQIIERLKQANNVLVTVSNDPSVDQLASAIGFTLLLNKLKKHGTAVFSGEVPSTIEFLQPEKTLEKNTDSLRDFIIALDKAKADKLRYKIEDKFVKIFITPYRTSIDEKDLEFSQGDFNVDVVVALGVKKRTELDQAITAHGRILHDATVISINKQPGENIGAINWNVPGASSFSEILVNVADLIKGDQQNIFDQQISTAFLTGIVAETERFSNDKTTPQTMSMASILMKAGANQQLIATKLEEPKPIPKEVPISPQPLASRPAALRPAPMPPEPPKPNDGTLEVAHEEPKPPAPSFPIAASPDFKPEPEPESDVEEIHIDEQGTLMRLEEMEHPKKQSVPLPGSAEKLPEQTSKFVQEPPSHSGAFTSLDDTDSSNNSPSSELVLPPVGGPILHHDKRPSPTPTQPEPQAPKKVSENQTLEDIEEAVGSAHVAQYENKADTADPNSIDQARQGVDLASAGTDNLKPIAALNAQPVDLNFANNPSDVAATTPSPQTDESQQVSNVPTAPPPVPPPLTIAPNGQPPAGPPASP